MKTKSFVKWQLKKWLPLFAVLSVLILGVVVINAFSQPLHYQVYDDYGYIYSYVYTKQSARFSGLQLIGNMMMIPICIIPFFVFSHRFDKNAADAYKAFPAPKRRITRTKILIGGAFILALVTLVYWSFVGIMGFRYAATPEKESILGVVYERYDYYFIWYLPAFFYLTISLLTSYLFNCTLVSFGNNGVSSFIYLLMGYAIMFISVYTLFRTFVYYYVDDYSPLSDLAYVFDKSSWYGTHFGRIDFISETFHDLVCLNSIQTKEGFFSIGRILGYLLFIGEIAIGVLALFVKEPSGEYYGAPGARKETHKAIIYVGMGISLLAIANAMSNTRYVNASDIIFLVCIVVIIYFTFVIFNKRFALSRTEVIVIISLISFYIVATIYTRIVDNLKETRLDQGVYYELQALSAILRNR